MAAATSARIGLALLDLDEPTPVLRRLPTWILPRLTPYERIGDVPNVIFPCCLVHDCGGEIRLYYGAADSSIYLTTPSSATFPKPCSPARPTPES